MAKTSRAQRKRDLEVIAKIKKVYDEKSFPAAFKADLAKAEALVLLQSPYLTTRALNQYRAAFADCVRRSVRTCLFLLKPRLWDLRNDPHFDAETKLKFDQLERNIQELRAMGMHVSVREFVHEKLAVIDDRIFWDGSLNILSHYDTKERFTRWNSPHEVRAGIAKHQLNTCDECAEHELFSLFNKLTPAQKRCEVIINQAAVRRKDSDLSQTELAALVGLHQTTLSKMEKGTRDTNFWRVESMMNELDLALLPCPRYMLPAMLDYFKKHGF